MPPRSLRSRAAPLTAPSATPTASSTRPRRGNTNQSPSSAVIQRSSPEETRQSIHLTVKADPSKLKKATSGNIPKGNARTTVTQRNIVSGKRASRNSRVVREVDSDDDEEEDEPEAMDVDDDEEDEDENEDEDEDAEGEEDDEVDAEGEEDEEMEDLPPPPPPRIVVSSKDKVPVNPVLNAKAQDSVEAKEVSMVDDDDDEELSELDSDLEGDEEDAEGEDDDEETALQNGDDDEDEDMDSDDGTPGSETPDLSKMTQRQRRVREAGDSDGGLMSLSNEAQKKKHLTAEEHAMRRAEMARRRKNLSEKRNEEEKMDTINRLLKKQPPKRGKRAIQDTNESGQEDEGEVEKANPLYVRYTQTISGTRMAVPEEWLNSPAGSVFAGDVAKPSHRPYGGRMVEEVA